MYTSEDIVDNCLSHFIKDLENPFCVVLDLYFLEYKIWSQDRELLFAKIHRDAKLLTILLTLP